MSTYTNLLKQRFSEPGALYGMWLSLGCADVAEAVAHAGFDWLCIDMEHSPNDSQDVVSQLRAMAAAHLPTEPIVRVPAHDGWLVKRVLDAGERRSTRSEDAHASELIVGELLANTVEHVSSRL